MSGIKHHEMVTALIKPGSAILETLTDKKADLLHMAVGVAGEAAEILLAIDDHVSLNRELDRANLIEELGDIEFYLEGARQNVGISHDEILDILEYNHNSYIDLSTLHLAARLSIKSGDFLDAVKKYVIYNKPQDFKSLFSGMSGIEAYMSALRARFDITREEVLAANIYKLAEGPNARYKKGYSDKAAQDRADKA